MLTACSANQLKCQSAAAGSSPSCYSRYLTVFFLPLPAARETERHTQTIRQVERERLRSFFKCIYIYFFLHLRLNTSSVHVNFLQNVSEHNTETSTDAQLAHRNLRVLLIVLICTHLIKLRIKAKPCLWSEKKLFSVFIIISYMWSIKNRRFLWIVKGYVEIILCEVPLYLLVCDSVCMKTHF